MGEQVVVLQFCRPTIFKILKILTFQVRKTCGSCVPFASPISRCLIQETNDSLVKEAEGAEADRVQDFFRLGIQHLQVVQQLESAPDITGSCSSSEVKAALLHHSDWEKIAENRATYLVHHVLRLQPAGQDTLPSLTFPELKDHQLQDPAVLSVLQFVIHRRRPSRRERCGMDARGLAMLKHWEKLKVHLSASTLLFWSAEDKNKSCVDVLVVTDHFTKMAHAFPCKKQTDRQEAVGLYFLHLWFPGGHPLRPPCQL